MRNPFLNKEGKYWYLYFYVNGKVKKRSTKESIRSKAEVFKAKFIQNDYEITEPKYILLSDFQKEYGEIISGNCRVKTVKDYNNAFNQFKKICGDKFLHTYSLKEINNFLSKKSQTTTEWTAKRYRIQLNASFNYALKMKYIKHNYFDDAIKFNPSPPDILYYSDSDLNKLLKVVSNPIHYDIILFGFYTGMRLGEILSLKKTDIFENVIYLQSNTKTKTPRIVSISNELIPIINKQKSKEYLFEFNNKKVSQNTISSVFKRYVKRSGINPKLNFHSLRKTFGSRLLQSGVNLKVISEMLGHSNYSTTEKFYATILKGFRNEVNLLKINK